jgi:hypothetical protein
MDWGGHGRGRGRRDEGCCLGGGWGFSSFLVALCWCLWLGEMGRYRSSPAQDHSPSFCFLHHQEKKKRKSSQNKREKTTTLSDFHSPYLLLFHHTTRGEKKGKGKRPWLQPQKQIIMIYSYKKNHHLNSSSANMSYMYNNNSALIS